MTEAILKRAEPAEIQEAAIQYLSACSLPQYVEQILAAVREFLQPDTIVYKHEVVRQLWKMVDEGKIIFRSGFLIPRVPTDPPQPQPMTEQHPITPPVALVAEWASESLATQALCTKAARWGADQELEACCEVVSNATVVPLESGVWLRNARRHKLPSLKDQGIESLDRALAMWMTNDFNKYEFVALGTNIRLALEALPEEAQ
jgi:hypothetical protein